MIISIINVYLDSLKLYELKKLAKLNNFKSYSNKTKQDLIDTVVKHYAILTIQRHVRKKLALNTVCPISLESLKYPFWIKKSITKTHKVGYIYYNLESFIDYLVSSGDFRDPMSRELLSEKDISRLDILAKTNKIKLYKSLKDTKDNKLHYRKIKDREEQIDILIERIRHIFWSIRDKIENVYNGYENVGELTYYINNVYFPETKHYVEILSKKCPEGIKYCIISFENAKNIISDINYQCNVIKHIKNYIINWIDERTAELIK